METDIDKLAKHYAEKLSDKTPYTSEQFRDIKDLRSSVIEFSEGQLLKRIAFGDGRINGDTVPVMFVSTSKSGNTAAYHIRSKNGEFVHKIYDWGNMLSKQVDFPPIVRDVVGGAHSTIRIEMVGTFGAVFIFLNTVTHTAHIVCGRGDSFSGGHREELKVNSITGSFKDMCFTVARMLGHDPSR